MAERKIQLTIYGTRAYEGEYKPQAGDVKRLGFGWFIYENGKWRRMKPSELRSFKKTQGNYRKAQKAGQ